MNWRDRLVRRLGYNIEEPVDATPNAGWVESTEFTDNKYLIPIVAEIIYGFLSAASVAWWPALRACDDTSHAGDALSHVLLGCTSTILGQSAGALEGVTIETARLCRDLTAQHELSLEDLPGTLTGDDLFNYTPDNNGASEDARQEVTAWLAAAQDSDWDSVINVTIAIAERFKKTYEPVQALSGTYTFIAMCLMCAVVAWAAEEYPRFFQVSEDT